MTALGWANDIRPYLDCRRDYHVMPKKCTGIPINNPADISGALFKKQHILSAAAFQDPRNAGDGVFVHLEQLVHAY